MSAPRLILVVDGGGSKTSSCLAVADSLGYRRLAESRLGPSNPLVVGVAQSRTILLEAVRDVVARAGLRSDQSLDTLVIGLAGLSSSGNIEDWTEWANRLVPASQTAIVPDIELLLRPKHEVPTIALVSGTGSIAIGRNDGQTARAGGRGYLLGDEGSGYWIGNQGLSAAIRSAEGRQDATQLTDVFARHFGTEDVQVWTRRVHQSDQPRQFLAGLAPLVIDIADADPCAHSILMSAADNLAGMVQSVANQLGVGNRFQLLLTGSILTNVPAITQALSTSTGHDGPTTSVDSPARYAAQRYAAR